MSTLPRGPSNNTALRAIAELLVLPQITAPAGLKMEHNKRTFNAPPRQVGGNFAQRAAKRIITEPMLIPYCAAVAMGCFVYSGYTVARVAAKDALRANEEADKRREKRATPVINAAGFK
jgi:hypothetical protein